MKSKRVAVALILIAALWRSLAVFAPAWSNISPVTALAFCGAVFWRDKRLWLIPFAALTISDIWLNYYHATRFGYTWSIGEMALRVAAVAAALGFGCLAARRPTAHMMLSGALASSLVFYFVTNTVAWIDDTFYPATFGGWWQAMTVGHPEFPPTLWFFRNTLIGDLFFSAVFFSAAKHRVRICELSVNQNPC